MPVSQVQIPLGTAMICTTNVIKHCQIRIQLFHKQLKVVIVPPIGHFPFKVLRNMQKVMQFTFSEMLPLACFFFPQRAWVAFS